MKRFLNQLIVALSVGAELVLLAAAVVLYPEYGHGVGYAMMIGLPLAELGIGLAAFVTPRWWVLLAALNVGLLLALRPLDAFLLGVLACAAAVSALVGWSCRTLP